MNVAELKRKLNNPGLVLVDALLDGTYLASSMVAYTASCATSNLEATESLKQSFYADDIPLALLMIFVFNAYAIIGAYCAKKKSQEIHWTLLIIASSWPYFRDFISGMKNGRHAVVDSGFIIQHTLHHAIYYLTNPIGIAVGVLLAFNLVWYRKMNTNRKELIKFNDDIKESHTYEDIKQHSTCQKSLNYVSAGFDGLTDGMYLFGCFFLLIGLGVSTLSAGAPLIAAIIVISIITISSFISKMHNEYEAQKKLTCSALQAEIRLLEEKEDSPLLQQKQMKLARLSSPVNTSDFSFGGKLLFFTGRAVLSGAKNATAAFNSIQALISNVAACIIVGAIALVFRILYPIYLALKTVCRQFSKIKTEAEAEENYLRNAYT